MHRSSDLVGIVINYYWRPSFAPSGRICTRLSIQALKENTGVGHIVLVDGSPLPDVNIQQICLESGVDYLHTGNELTFAQGYNTGWKLLKEPYVGLMANDIIPPQGTIETLLRWIRIPDIGCVFPYLSNCDYPGQIDTYVRKAKTCEPTSMTLNLNIFKKEVLEDVGGIDEGYLGCYNDVILLMKIRKRGYRVVLVGDTRVVHIGQMTIIQGSNHKKEADVARFSQEFSSYWASHGKWNITRWRWPFSTSKTVSLMWWVAQNFPSSRARSFLQWFTIWLEPTITQYPTKYGKDSF